MKVSLGLTWVSAALNVYAASQEASLYIQDNSLSPTSSKAQSISPTTARLLLAQRLGLSQYHELGAADEGTLDVLNTYGGLQQSAFEDEQPSRQQRTDKLLFIIEGVEYAEDVMDSEERPILTIADPPDSKHNAKLAQDLLEQSLHAGSGKTMSHIKHNLSLQGLTRKDGQRYHHAITTLKTVLKTFQHQIPTASRTIILMPPSPKSKRSSEDLSSSPYGSYSMPFARRHAQSPQQEEPLEDFPPTDTSKTPPTAPLSASNSSTSPSAFPPLPKGILKICHSKADEAIAATNNCSSHGAVYLRAKGSIDCWACRCGTTTTTTESGGVKTTHWGGPACQKKDVSFQFWLLAGLTVLLVAVVGWGVGLLYSIGEEDLPSVIGAGVAGPRAQK